jgi:hypothetical protein
MLKGAQIMNRLPGFTAETALYRTSELYAQVSTGMVGGTSEAAVVPQICITIPICIPGLNRKVRVCCGLFSGCSYSLVSC